MTDHGEPDYEDGYEDGFEDGGSEPHRLVVDGEISVCDTCVNSEGNPVAWDLTWHEEGRVRLLAQLRENYRAGLVEGFTRAAGRAPKFSEIRDFPGMNGIPAQGSGSD